MGGFSTTVIQPIYSDAAVPVLGPGLLPPTGAMVLEILQTVEIVGLFVVPSIIEQMTMISGAMQILQNLKFICYAGGPLAPTVGDQLCRHVDLCQFYGTTEAISPPQLVPTANDWQYMEWHPDFKGTMEPSDDDAFELVYHYKNLDPYHSAILHNLPNLKEYRTKDLFMQHQSKPGLWRFYGRKDDIIVLANGEKFNPVPMEIALLGNSSIVGAVVVGQGKSEASLLLEANKPVESESDWIEKVWPDVEKANALLPTQGRIIQSRIIVGSPTKPFIRAGKGTVIRKLTADLYKDELETLYNNPVIKKAQRPTLKARFDLQDVKELVSAILTSVLSERTLNHDDNLFAAGIDSLKSIEALENLKAELRPYAKDNDLQWLGVQILYNHASVEDLSKVISDFLNNGTIPVSSDSPSIGIEELIEKFTRDLPSATPESATSKNNKNYTVGILGSRGSLGSAIRHSFLGDMTIAKVVCIDRASSQSTGHKADSGPELQNLSIDYTKPDLGLSQQSLEEILSRLDILIFNAWPVDFNLPLQAFIPNLQALRYLLGKLTATSTHIVFVSSIAAAGVLSHVELSTGYGRSKFIAEQILGAAARVSGIRGSILRVGQIAPASKSGASAQARTWPIKEWFPALCKASQTLRVFPNDLGAIDWIPLDSLGDIVKETALHDSTLLGSHTANAYTIVNPHNVPWSLVVEEIKRNTSTHGVSDDAENQFQFVPLVDWIEKAEFYQQTEKTDELQAIKLLPFFRGIAHASGRIPATEQDSSTIHPKIELVFKMPSQTPSPTLADLKPISQAEIEDWVRQIFLN